MHDTHTFDAIAAEKKELNLLLGIGTPFSISLKPILGIKGIKQTFRIPHPKLGTRDYMSNEQIKFIYDNEEVKEFPIEVAKKITENNVKVCARIIAMSILNSDKKIKYLGSLFAGYLQLTVTAENLFEYARFIDNLLDNASFNKLYSIPNKTQDNETEEEKASRTGLNSPYGYRGAMCEKFGWTWNYLHWGISWAIVERMMLDAPGYVSPKKKDSSGQNKPADTTIIQGDFSDILNHLKNIQR